MLKSNSEPCLGRKTIPCGRYNRELRMFTIKRESKRRSFIPKFHAEISARERHGFQKSFFFRVLATFPRKNFLKVPI